MNFDECQVMHMEKNNLTYMYTTLGSELAVTIQEVSQETLE